ncbi:hypothetical protein CLU84_3246 [Comamonas sp. 26]|nr:hypothetical protein CLU84_3246 [Comamonas sp. 26]
MTPAWLLDDTLMNALWRGEAGGEAIKKAPAFGRGC